MANQKLDDVEDEEALFNSFCPVVYYVQSPSTTSHANSTDYRNSEPAFLSPNRYQNFLTTRPKSLTHAIARFIHSRHSSRGSSKTFQHEKRISYDVQSSHETSVGTENGDSGALLRICGSEQDNKDVHKDDEEDYEEEEEEEEYATDEKAERQGCLRLFSFGTSPSWYWITLQMSWRLLVSFSAALLVFFLATNPPPPTMSIKVAGVQQFGLGEGVDHSGVTTKILTCNCSMDLYVDNKSKLFGLHIRPSVIKMSFGPFIFATSLSPKLYAESHELSPFNLYVGTKNKAMYGAGPSMQDMLESGKGMPLIIRLRLRSNYKVVWNLIKPKFHHNVECMVVLHGGHRTHHTNTAFSSHCRPSTS